MVPPRPPQHAVALAEELGHQDARVHALGQRVPVAAVGRRHPVVRGEVGADADGGGLLADIEMQEAGGLALAAGDLGDAFEAAEEHHPLVEGEHARPVERGFGGLVPEAMD